MPRDTKNSAPKVSRSGMISAKACRAKPDWLISRPAVNAPKAADSSSLTVPKAAARHTTITVNRNSSRVRCPATFLRNHGIPQ
ncbi:hypothetical protein ES703_95201 [subsurface metagenome]